MFDNTLAGELINDVQEYQAIVQNQSSLLYRAFVTWQSRSKVRDYCKCAICWPDVLLVCSGYSSLRNQFEKQDMELVACRHALGGSNPQGTRMACKARPMYVQRFS